MNCSWIFCRIRWKWWCLFGPSEGKQTSWHRSSVLARGWRWRQARSQSCGLRVEAKSQPLNPFPVFLVSSVVVVNHKKMHFFSRARFSLLCLLSLEHTLLWKKGRKAEAYFPCLFSFYIFYASPGLNMLPFRMPTWIPFTSATWYVWGCDHAPLEGARCLHSVLSLHRALGKPASTCTGSHCVWEPALISPTISRPPDFLLSPIFFYPTWYLFPTCLLHFFPVGVYSLSLIYLSHRKKGRC